MKKTTVFQTPLPIPGQRTHEIVSGVLVFVFLPIVNCLILCSGRQRPLYNSISRLAWPEGLLWLVYIWGLLNIGGFFYATWLTLRAGGYVKKWSRIIVSMEIVAALLMTVGVSIPSYPYDSFAYLAMRTFHTAISSVGFFLFFVILSVLSITTFRRNERQALLSLAFNAFILIAGIFFLVKVTDPTSYCHVSAPSQMLVFDLFNINALLNYFGMTLFRNERLKSEDEETNIKQIA